LEQKLGHRFTVSVIWIVLACVSSFAVTAKAAPPCSELVASPHFQRIQYQAKAGVVPITDALSDYDRSQEVLVVFHYQHVSLYFGKYFWEWTGDHYKHREDPHAIPVSVTFRIRVGADRIRALESEIESQRFLQIAQLTCQHRALALLQRNGISLGGGVALWGTSIYRNIIARGFVDAKGERYSMTIHSIHPSGEDQLEPLHSFLKNHHAEYFLHFSATLAEISAADLSRAFVKCTTDLEYLDIPRLLADEILRNRLTARQTEVLNAVLDSWERRLLTLTALYLGPPSHIFMHVMTTSHLPIARYRPQMIETLEQSICEAVQ
jgi:hypothetical protein